MKPLSSMAANRKGAGGMGIANPHDPVLPFTLTWGIFKIFFIIAGLNRRLILISHCVREKFK